MGRSYSSVIPRLGRPTARSPRFDSPFACCFRRPHAAAPTEARGERDGCAPRGRGGSEKLVVFGSGWPAERGVDRRAVALREQKQARAVNRAGRGMRHHHRDLSPSERLGGRGTARVGRSSVRERSALSAWTDSSSPKRTTPGRSGFEKSMPRHVRRARVKAYTRLLYPGPSPSGSEPGRPRVSDETAGGCSDLGGLRP